MLSLKYRYFNILQIMKLNPIDIIWLSQGPLAGVGTVIQTEGFWFARLLSFSCMIFYYMMGRPNRLIVFFCYSPSKLGLFVSLYIFLFHPLLEYKLLSILYLLCESEYAKKGKVYFPLYFLPWTFLWHFIRLHSYKTKLYWMRQTNLFCLLQKNIQ